MVLVDSSVWIEAMRKTGDIGTKVALEQLLDAYEAAFCSPVKLEVLVGARTQFRKKTAAYFSIVPYLDVIEDDWQAAIQYGHELRDHGVTVPNNDLLIATVALRAQIRVFARDKHFDLMAEHLPLQLYKPGYGGSYSPG